MSCWAWEEGSLLLTHIRILFPLFQVNKKSEALAEAIADSETADAKVRLLEMEAEVLEAEAEVGLKSFGK
jgi:hypothetical protein